jgi:hypothetical protein
MSQIPSTFFGLQSKPVGGTYPVVSFGTYRVWDPAVDWATLNTSSGTYNWTPLDTVLANLYAGGVKDGVIYAFGVAPDWASQRGSRCAGNGNPDSSCTGLRDSGCSFENTTPPTAYGGCWTNVDLDVNAGDGDGSDATFVNFVQAIAEHVNNSTYLLNHAHIKYWEPWNEWYRNPR